MLTSQRCKAAAKAIRNGWCQFRWRDDDGNVCFMQAISEALGYTGINVLLPRPIQLALDAHLMATVPSYCATKSRRKTRKRALSRPNGYALQKFMWTWNDMPERTAEEVASTLDALAARLEAQERNWMRGLIARAIRPVPRTLVLDASASTEFALV